MPAPNMVLHKGLRGLASSKSYHILADDVRKNTKRVILFTNARNEKNMKEWAAHHLLIGFDLIYIFDHKSTVPLQHEFRGFDKRVIVERCNWENPVKLPLMKRAAKISESLNADWFLYLDADEFLMLNAFFGVKQMLNVYSYADSLAINWLMFGTNNHVKEPVGLILENYTRSDAKLNKHVKSFVRPSQVTNVTNPHFYHIKNPYRNITITNKVIPPNPFNECNIGFNHIPAYIAHYINQSEETYIKRKVLMPTDDTNAFRGRDLNIHANYNDNKNEMPKLKYVPEITTFLQRFSK